MNTNVSKNQSKIASLNLNKSNTTAKLLIPKQLETLYSIHILGKPAEPAMYKYLERIMICHKCLNSHTKKRCRQTEIYPLAVGTTN